MIKHFDGDIFTSELDVIGHGVNCLGQMGAGIAKTVKQIYPVTYNVYRKACKTIGLEGGDLLPVLNPDGRWILNLASQYDTGRNADLEFLEDSLESTYAWCRDNGKTAFALPEIGCGIGGLDWDTEVLPLMEEYDKKNPDITLEVWHYVPEKKFFGNVKK